MPWATRCQLVGHNDFHTTSAIYVMLVHAPGGRPYGTVDMPGDAPVPIPYNPETRKESKAQDPATRKQQDTSTRKKTVHKKRKKNCDWGGKRPVSNSATHHAQALCNGRRLPEDAIRAIRNGTSIKKLCGAFPALGLPT